MIRRVVPAVLAASASVACGGETRDLCASDDPPASCTCDHLACDQVVCDGDATTSVSGRVLAPNGVTPLPGVTVYVPNAAVPPLPEALTCTRCDQPAGGAPLVTATTDVRGEFVLTDVPATTDVPLVIQIGRWRRQITIPAVAACADTALAPESTRLPRNQDEGDLPRVALSTGGADSLECLLRKVGIDDREFTDAGGPGRIHLYAGVGGTARFDAAHGGTALTDATTLWADAASLGRYDIAVLSCEGGRHPETKPPAAVAAMKAYADGGGRVFASHWHNIWIDSAPAPWPDVITRVDDTPLLATPAEIDQSFPRGELLARWLVDVGASPQLGAIQLSQAQHTVSAIDPALARSWIHIEDTGDGTPSVQYLSFTTPVEVAPELRCGRVVFSDLHASADDAVFPDPGFPSTSCNTPLSSITPQEMVLLFMLFDIGTCIPDVTQ